jgi:hypothetical protein
MRKRYSNLATTQAAYPPIQEVMKLSLEWDSIHNEKLANINNSLSEMNNTLKKILWLLSAGENE